MGTYSYYDSWEGPAPETRKPSNDGDGCVAGCGCGCMLLLLPLLCILPFLFPAEGSVFHSIKKGINIQINIGK